MKRNRFNIRNLVGAVALIAALGFSLVAQGASSGLSKTVVLTSGKAETVMLPKSAADVLVANPAIADVGSLRADRLVGSKAFFPHQLISRECSRPNRRDAKRPPHHGAPRIAWPTRAPS